MFGLVPFNKKGSDSLEPRFANFNNVLDDLFANDWSPRRSLRSDVFKLDIKEDKQKYYISAQVPGVEKEELDVILKDGRLNISINKNEEIEEKDKNYLHRETMNSSMKRCIYLGEVDENGVEAKLNNGILNINVKKKEIVDTSKKVEIH